LSPGINIFTSPFMMQTEIFDRKARRRAAFGALCAPAADRWLLARMADEILFRLSAVKRDFESVLLLGPYANTMASHCEERGLSGVIASLLPVAGPWPVVQCDEDRLAIKDQSFDLVIAVGGLDTVNDLPGALILVRRILKPGGLFLGSMVGAGSLMGLRTLLASGEPVLRTHPQIDVRASGDLLARAGFALPVADAELAEARYSDLNRLLADIRANALGNCLAARTPLGRQSKANLQAGFDAAKMQQGRFVEQANLLYLTGWAPDAQ
jgi:SAM-dependent methyltransferase